jgi:hypothetical protein
MIKRLLNWKYFIPLGILTTIVLLLFILLENRYLYINGGAAIWRLDKFTNAIQLCTERRTDPNGLPTIEIKCK